jgi:hypothetical protein
MIPAATRCAAYFGTLPGISVALVEAVAGVLAPLVRGDVGELGGPDPFLGNGVPTAAVRRMVGSDFSAGDAGCHAGAADDSA